MTALTFSTPDTDRSFLRKALSTPFLLRWLLCTALLSALSAAIAMTSATIELRNTLAQQLPPRLSQALQFSFVSSTETIALISDAINQDLASLTVTGRAGLLHNCHAQLLQLLDSAAPPDQRSAVVAPSSARPGPMPWPGLLPVTSSLQVDWTRGDYLESASVQLQCQLHVPRLLGLNATLTLLVLLVMVALPVSLSQRLPWLLLGLKRYGYTLPGLRQALSIALAPATMRFDHRHHTVTIHGVALTLPKTPYFYYAWYAGLRLQRDSRGWLLNPATDRPDRTSAAALTELMISAGGHQKAINDLTEHGLRAKILDQNRNKVKDELCRELGESLAADYLFESERDARTARYRYRLACPPHRIKLTKQASTSIDHPG